MFVAGLPEAKSFSLPQGTSPVRVNPLDLISALNTHLHSLCFSPRSRFVGSTAAWTCYRLALRHSIPANRVARHARNASWLAQRRRTSPTKSRNLSIQPVKSCSRWSVSIISFGVIRASSRLIRMSGSWSQSVSLKRQDDLFQRHKSRLLKKITIGFIAFESPDKSEQISMNLVRPFDECSVRKNRYLRLYSFQLHGCRPNVLNIDTLGNIHCLRH